MKNLICFMLWWITTVSVAQENKLPSIYVKLDNGSVFTGLLLEYKADESYTILIGDNRFTFPVSVIDKLKILDDGEISFQRFREKVFYHRLSGGLLGNENLIGFTFHYTFSYQLTHRLSGGAGVGIDNYMRSSGYDLFPIFIESRYNLLKDGSSPFLFLKSGYSIAKARLSRGQTQAEGGLLFNPGLGVRLGSRDLMVDLYGGVRIQRARYVYAFSDQSITDTHTFKRIEFGIGFMF
ncbi:MAG TPA: hypothetical protein PKC30_10815 [Saprospiraceae bacterium]|nr:hypothetical protein [Saprospiraceae bacterium]